MSWLMRKSVVIPAGTTIVTNGKEEKVEANLTGFPAGFALTAFQQDYAYIVAR